MKNISKKRLFVSEIVTDNKHLKNITEVEIINEVKEKLLSFLLVDGIEEAIRQITQIIGEITNGCQVKGNIYYSCIRTDDEMNIEIVRHAHGGGSNQSKRETGGVVIAVIKTVKVKGELSQVHGFTWYNEKDKNPFAHIFG